MIHLTDCVLIMGSRGCGKSYLCQNIQKLWPRRIVFDTLDEYQEGDLVYSFDEYSEKLQEYLKSKRESFVLVFKFDPESDTDHVEFDQAMRLAYYYGNLQVVIEEVQEFSNPHTMPKWLKNCLLTGRHQKISVIATTQRPGELHKTILSQSSHIFCGRIIEGNDLRYVSSFLNQDAEKLSKLPDRRFVYFSRDGVREIENNINVAR
jgi:DNA helicase HerA-like ATPase